MDQENPRQLSESYRDEAGKKSYEDAEKDESLFAQTDEEIDLSESPWTAYFVETNAEADAEIEWVAIPGLNT